MGSSLRPMCRSLLARRRRKMMARCIATDADCAEICRTAAALMARGSEFAQQVCKLCAQICKACTEECAKHEARHCRDCAQACTRCADECSKMTAYALTIQRQFALKEHCTHFLQFLRMVMEVFA